MDDQQPTGRQTHNLSCDPEESAAFVWMADTEDRGVKAWTFQKMIDQAMRQKVGSNWREWVRAELMKESVAA